MQDELLNTRLSKKERKRIERLLMDYHRMPSKIESAKMRAEQATTTTASYSLREGSGSSAPSDPTFNAVSKRSEVEQMERLRRLLEDLHELLTYEERQIWDLVYHPRHRYDHESARQAINISKTHYFYLRNRLISQIASAIEGKYDVTFWESDQT